MLIAKDSSSIDFPAAGNGRYHLYVSYACPWAHRTLMVRALKGLEDDISVSIVHPVWRRTRPDDPNDFHTGWFFGVTPDDDGTYESSFLTNSDGNGGPFPLKFPMNEPDPHGNALSIRDVYERAAANRKDGQTGGVFSVPILWDSVKNTIVSNESSEIIRMLNSEFNEFCTNPDLDLYPPNLRAVIDEVNDWIYRTINNGVYRCGFSKSQEAYNEAIAILTESLDRVDEILQKQRYIAGNQFTEADVRLFVTLLRFDEVYIVYFKCNTRSVEHSDAILDYCREIYQMPGVKETINMEQIKTHYFAAHPKLNYYSILPAGRNFIQLLEQSHNRNKL
jgi:glutathionyl-hydroquinone reductase